jgi:tyrosyl-tRNA synthetase
MEEIQAMQSWQGSELNKAKEILAYEVTKTVHGTEAADSARQAAKALFAGGGDMDAMPCTDIPMGELGGGMSVLPLLTKCGLIPSASEGRRLITQGGIKINEQKIESHDVVINKENFIDGYLMIQKGKKVFHRVKLV